MTTDWFERLMGFRETDYATTQSLLMVDGDTLTSTVNDQSYGIGRLTLPTLAQLRARVTIPAGPRTTVTSISGDVRTLHAQPQLEGALFQVASQFNLLEMVGQDVTPEQGVTRYAWDRTQGPACAIAAGAATIYRNYAVPVEDQTGQTSARQLDALAHLGSALSEALGRPVSALWTMHNGYAACSRDGLRAINELLDGATTEERAALSGALAIGLHRDVEVTDVETKDQFVSQAYCSALPVAYYRDRGNWEAFARLVLESAYEATLLAAVEQAGSGGSNTVLLTRLGGGAFGNDDAWIDDAMVRALRIVEHAGLDVRIVSYGPPDASVRKIVDDWAPVRVETSEGRIGVPAKWPHDNTFHAWWVEPGKLLAGEYPGATTPEKAAAKLRMLSDAGVDAIIDLTQDIDGLRPYARLLDEIAADTANPMRRYHHPIPDNHVIDNAGYDDILARINTEIDSGATVYVHCWGGRGRTSTVVGCWLIEQRGLDYDSTIARLVELRAHTRKSRVAVPESRSQHQVLRRRASPIPAAPTAPLESPLRAR